MARRVSHTEASVVRAAGQWFGVAVRETAQTGRGWTKKPPNGALSASSTRDGVLRQPVVAESQSTARHKLLPPLRVPCTQAVRAALSARRSAAALLNQRGHHEPPLWFLALAVGLDVVAPLQVFVYHLALEGTHRL